MMKKLFYTSGTTALQKKKKKVMVDGNDFSIKESVELLHVCICLARCLSSIKILHGKKKKPCEEGGIGSHMQGICLVNSTQH